MINQAYQYGTESIEVMYMRINFSPPDITELEINEVVEALKSGWITTGPRTKELEKKIAHQLGTPKSVCLNSATAALEMSLRVFGIGPGDEVITSAYSYTASASPVVHVGATLVLVDTQKDSYEMDYDAVARAITPKTKAIIPVDIAGVPCDYERLRSIVEEKKSLFIPSNDIQSALGHIPIVADCAHSFGATYKGVHTGNVADFSSFSFHAVKNFTTAEGGCATWRHIDGYDDEAIYKQFQLLSCAHSFGATYKGVHTGNVADFSSFSFHAVKNFTTAEGGCATWRHIDGYDDEAIYKQFQLLSLHGQDKDALAKTKASAWEYDIKGTYYKCNMTDIMAAIGLAQLERYPKLLARRKEIIETYDTGLKDLPVTLLSHYTEKHESSGHLYLVRLDGRDAEYRNKVIEAMAEAGIATNVHYKPIPMHTAYKNLGFTIDDYPNAYDQFKNEITLPLHTLLTDEEVQYIIEQFKRIITEC